MLRFSIFSWTHFFQYALAVILLSTALQVQGQETKIDTTLAVTPQALELRDVGAESEGARTKVSRSIERLSSTEEITSADSLFASTEQSYNRDLEMYRAFRKTIPNRQKLDVTIFKWKSKAETRDRWQSDVRSYLAKTSVALEQLEFELETWQLTRDAAIEADAPPSLINTISNTVEIIDSALTEVERQTNIALDISARIAAQKNQINTILGDLQNWASSGELNIFYKRHEAIWNSPMVFAEEGEDRTAFETFTERVTALKEYIRDYTWQLRFVGLLSLIIIALMYVIKRAIDRHDFEVKDEELANARHVVGRRTALTAFYFNHLYIRDTSRLSYP